MNNDIDLKALWQQQPSVPPPDTKELFARVAKLKRKNRNKLILTNVLLIATCIYLSWVVWLIHPKMITTWLSLVIFLVAMISYLVVYNRMTPLLLKDNTDKSAQEYLQQLILLKKKQEFLYTKMLTMYFILLSIGMALYFVEIAAPLGFIGKIVTYTLTGGFFLFAWFYIRPRKIKKQRAELNAVIEKLEAVNGQLGE
jgi:hypothetical protein